MLRDMSVLQILVSVAGIGALIAWHELSHYLLARLLGMRVLKYSIGFGPKLWGFKKGDIEYQVAALPLGGFVQIKGMSSLEEGATEDPKSFVNRPRWARFLVLAAGPGFNYLMAAFLFFLYLWMWPSPVGTLAVELSEVQPDKPAAAAGLVPGDVVVSIDGKTFEEPGDFKSAITSKNGAPVTLQVLKNGVTTDVTLTPVRDGNDLLIGVGPNVRYPRASVLATAMSAVDACRGETVRTLQAFGALFRREGGADVASPVKIVAQMKERVAKGFRFFVFILALLSVNLGLLNLLPVPSLDGIKMLFLTIEGTIRRDLHAGFQVWVNALGLLALLGLMVVLMARDTIQMLG